MCLFALHLCQAGETIRKGKMTMKNTKKVLALLLSAVLTLSLAACGGPSAPAEEPAATRTVTDVWNRQVEIPEQVETIVCLGSMAPRFAAYLDVVDMMVGAEDTDIETMSARYDYSPVYHEQLKTLPAVGAGGGSGENNGYAEQIIQVQPDVILAGFSAEAADELQRQTGIPVVSVRYRAQAFIDQGFYDTLRLFADVVGAQERCEEVLGYIDQCKADLNDRTKDVPETEKKRVYTGAVTFNGRHGFPFTYVNFPALLAVNGLNVADEFLEKVTGEAADTAAQTGTAYVGQNGFEVDLEQILQWDPDVVFLDPGNMDLVNDEIRTNPGFFQALRAIQEGEVYTMPSTNSAGPNITYLLSNAYYAGIVLYPDRFSDIDITEKTGEIMEHMLGKNFVKEMEEGGLYYGKIDLDV